MSEQIHWKFEMPFAKGGLRCLKLEHLSEISQRKNRVLYIYT